ncbi:MAG: AraC family transcriptional regulator [Clostridia bacterium]|nr:AraC family transcriptional regulator [Clostridia bacterium]
MFNYDFLPAKYMIQIYPPEFSELHVLEVGYNDLNHVAPFKHQRKQEFFTLHFVLEGEGTLFFRGKSYNLKENDMFFLPPNEAIKYFPKSTNPWKYFWVAFNGSKAEEYMKKFLFSVENPVYKAQTAEQFKMLARDFFYNNPNYNSSAEKCLAFFYTLLGRLKEERLGLPHGAHNETDYYIERIRKLVYLNYSNPNFKMEDLALMIHLSHSYMCSIFKKATKISVKAYLSGVRMEQAAELLLNTDSPISDIGYKVGFIDALYFSKKFRETYGVSPSQYRKANKNNPTP